MAVWRTVAAMPVLLAFPLYSPCTLHRRCTVYEDWRLRASITGWEDFRSMLSMRLDPDLERLLERDVDDLARYNILRFLHDNQSVREDAEFFADRLGLRPTERVEDALKALVRCGLVVREASATGARYGLSPDPQSMDLVERLCRLSSTESYGEVVERLAARSLHRARRAQPLPKTEGTNGFRI